LDGLDPTLVNRMQGPAFNRFSGKVTIEKVEKDVRMEIVDDHAI
jgi:hypothetical protein